MIEEMSGLPARLRQTLTGDQGVKMSNHVAIAKATDLDIYFRDPHLSWQRGSNENTNGLPRQYFAIRGNPRPLAFAPPWRTISGCCRNLLSQPDSRART